MSNPISPLVLLGAIVALTIALGSEVVFAESIDPANDNSQFAWSENAGWINFEPSQGPGVTVTDSSLTGFAWGENIGWLSMSCEGTSSCADVNYGVSNDAAGNLSGYAWNENAGWVSFSCSSTSSCADTAYGVTIDVSTGEFSGYAWNENTGWIGFSCANTSSCADVDYGVATSWRPGIEPPEPVSVNDLLTLVTDPPNTSFDEGALVFTITATFENTGGVPISDPFFKVAVLEGAGCPCTVLGFGGVGAEIPINVGADRMLEVSEQFAYTFNILLSARAPFDFFVNVFGVIP